MTFPEIAQEMGISKQAVHSAYLNAISKMRRGLRARRAMELVRELEAARDARAGGAGARTYQSFNREGVSL